MLKHQHSKKAFLGLFSISLAVVVFYWVPNENPKAPIMAAIAVIMAMFWVFEVVPIPITSLFPLVLFPLFEIAESKETAVFYGKDIIFLFLGGLILAQAIQVTNLHKRLALNTVRIIGTNPINMVLGFMVATAFISMWISNTASVMVMMPIAISIIDKTAEKITDQNLIKKLGLSLLLGIAYAADIGGMATLVGTPPNMVFVEMYRSLFPDLPPVGFTEWMLMGLPISIAFIFTGWLLMTRVIFRLPKFKLFENKGIIKEELKQLGKVRQDEWVAGIVFGIAVLLWLTGSDLTISETFTIRGWRTIFNLPMVNDSAVAIGTAVLLFMIPSKERRGEMMLKWDYIKNLPWGILLLFGGGFALAGGFENSGLSTVIGNIFNKVSIDSPLALIIIVCFILTILTEFTSNTATTNLVLPILAKASIVLGVDPRILMIPATLSASCAFMMPVASPTQAIIFGSGRVPIKEMVRAGILFNLLGVIIIGGIFYLLANFVFGIHL